MCYTEMYAGICIDKDQLLRSGEQLALISFDTDISDIAALDGTHKSPTAQPGSLVIC